MATKAGRMSEIEYRLHWARTHLKAIGAVENSARGVWAITDKGQAISPEEMQAATKAWRAGIRARRIADRAAEDEEAPDEAVCSSWKDQLVAWVLELPPAGFRAAGTAHPCEAGFVTSPSRARAGTASTVLVSTGSPSCRSREDDAFSRLREEYPSILTTAQVAELLDLNPRPVLLMAADGRLPASRLPGSRRFHFSLEDVLDTLKQHRVAPTPSPPTKPTRAAKKRAR